MLYTFCYVSLLCRLDITSYGNDILVTLVKREYSKLLFYMRGNVWFYIVVMGQPTVYK